MSEYKRVPIHENGNGSATQMIDLGLHEETLGGPGILEQMYKGQPRIGLECRRISWSIPSTCLARCHWTEDEAPTLLHHINMQAPPCSLTAVMGASGSGKTTLLDILARRRTGEEGQVLWYRQHSSGPDDTAHIVPRFGFVGRHHALYPRQTVRETLATAIDNCVQGQVWTTHQRRLFCVELLRLLSLDECADVRVGSEGMVGCISSGQRRMVAIGLGLVTFPNVLLLDEPTSSLDVHTARSVIQLLHRLSKLGCTIIVTIHQASAQIFELFDHVMLIANGRVLYGGERSKVMAYFHEEIKDTDNKGNPAEQLLDICVSKEATRLANVYEQKTQNVITFGIAEHTVEWTVDTQTTCMRQFATLFRRAIINQARDTRGFLVRLVMYIMLCMVIGSVYHGLDADDDVASMHDRAIMHVFTLSCLIALTVAFIPTLHRDRGVFEQEFSNGHYHPLVHAVVYSITPVPYLVLLATVCTLTMMIFVQVSVDGSGTVLYGTTLFLSFYCAESMLTVTSLLSSDVVNSLFIGAGVLTIQSLICGFYRVPSHMPGWAGLLRGVIMHRYAVDIVLYDDLHTRVYRLPDCPGSGQHVANASCLVPGQVLLSTMEMGVIQTDMWNVVILLLAVGWRAIYFVYILLLHRRWCGLKRSAMN